VGREDVGKLIGIFGLQRGQDPLGGEVVGELGILLEQLHELRHVPGDGIILGHLHFHLLHSRRETAVLVLDFEQSGPTQTLHHDFDVARGKLEVLHDPSDDAQCVNVFLAGIIDLGIFLGGQEDLLVGTVEGTFQGHYRWSATDHEWRHHVRIDHHVP